MSEFNKEEFLKNFNDNIIPRLLNKKIRRILYHSDENSIMINMNEDGTDGHIKDDYIIMLSIHEGNMVLSHGQPEGYKEGDTL